MLFGWYQCTLHHGSDARCAVETLQEGFGAEPLVSANRNKSISFLSNAAEPQCVLVKELQLGRRYAESREIDVTAVNASDSPRAVQRQCSSLQTAAPAFGNRPSRRLREA